MIQIQLIGADVRREEMMLSISSCLADLQMTSSMIFGEINNKISLLDSRLRDIDVRTEKAQQKIQQIRDKFANKATKIMANYKYPVIEVADDANDYEPIAKYCNKYYTQAANINMKSPHVPFDEELLKEKTQFFSVPKITKSKHQNGIHSLNAPDERLGPIPWNTMTCISSLVVFNTADNAYSRQSQGWYQLFVSY